MCYYIHDTSLEQVSSHTKITDILKTTENWGIIRKSKEFSFSMDFCSLTDIRKTPDVSLHQVQQLQRIRKLETKTTIGKIRVSAFE